MARRSELCWERIGDLVATVDMCRVRGRVRRAIVGVGGMAPCHGLGSSRRRSNEDSRLTAGPVAEGAPGRPGCTHGVAVERCALGLTCCEPVVAAAEGIAESVAARRFGRLANNIAAAAAGPSGSTAHHAGRLPESCAVASIRV